MSPFCVRKRKVEEEHVVRRHRRHRLLLCHHALPMYDTIITTVPFKPMARTEFGKSRIPWMQRRVSGWMHQIVPAAFPIGTIYCRHFSVTRTNPVAMAPVPIVMPYSSRNRPIIHLPFDNTWPNVCLKNYKSRHCFSPNNPSCRVTPRDGPPPR